MPMYEFRCGACGSRFEELAGPGTATTTCPECGAEASRLLSVPAPPRRLTMTPGQTRRSEDSRGVDRGGAMQRFKRRRAREKRGGGSGG